MTAEPRDWVEWHRAYDDPTSRLSRRLAVVQEQLRRAIDASPPGPLRIISICAGEGRDVIGVLAKHARRGDVSARLVELEPRNAAFARAAAKAAGLSGVEVVEGDAALLDSYTGAVPAEIVLACGIFGNITEDDIRRTVEYLPCLCADGAMVLWTRGHFKGERDVALDIRRWFIEGGFEEVAYVSPEAPEGAGYRVGANRLAAPPRPLEPGVRMFRFFR
jgi:putative methyltransferase